MPSDPRRTAYRRNGRRPSERRLPAPKLVTTWTTVPDRLVADERISPTARIVGANICRLAKDEAAMAIALGDTDLAKIVGLSRRALQYCLEELEASGWIYRHRRTRPLARETLALAGFVDPWGEARSPARALVLLWRLPQLPADLREGTFPGFGAIRPNRPTPRRKPGGVEP